LDDFTVFQKMCLEWPDALGVKANWKHPLYGRIQDALEDAKAESCEQVEHGDIAGLVGHALRREFLRSPEHQGNVMVSVPKKRPWPTESTWREFGTRVDADGDRLLLRPRLWKPDWLDTEDVGHAVFREDQRRDSVRVPADPKIRELTNFNEYSSKGQRRACQMAMLLAPGKSLLVNLPTGEGKSLVFQAAVLDQAARRQGAISVIVVPTTALGEDQKQRFKKLLEPMYPEGVPELLYHSGLTADGRDSIRSNIRNGKQPLIIASPESLVGSLRSALQQAARQGHLKWLVLDEAHMVAQWGQDFRPSFQVLSGLRNQLIEEAKGGQALRTLLLTATLTEDGLDTLTQLFGGKDLELVSATFIRTEPEYYVAACKDESERRTKLVEAIRHVPRPFKSFVISGFGG
jgi:ATP-dependent DNA helicase RecQ